MKEILLINPPIYDFAAFDLWSKPLGLLYLSAILKQQGVSISFLDYMDRHFNGISSKSNKYACGHYIKVKQKTPPVLKNIPRNYSRYGISQEYAENYLKTLKKPDMIFITSIMTYWYPGVVEAIGSVRKVFPKTPIAVGGVYATLCSEHAKKLGADFLIEGSLLSLNKLFKERGSNLYIPEKFSSFPSPDHSMYSKNDYICLRLSFGCPFRCSYCAQDILCGGQYDFKDPETVFQEIYKFYAKGIKNIVFYDDALLYNADNLIKPILKKIIDSEIDINIHTPNGLHLRYLDHELAELMKKAGFIMPRFSLESSSKEMQTKTGGKVTNDIFEKAVKILNKAGFNKGEFLIYLLMGLPDQSFEEVERSIRYVNEFGGKVSLSEYSIVPGTRASVNIPEQFIKEPLLQNPSIYPTVDLGDWESIRRLKNLAIELNSML